MSAWSLTNLAARQGARLAVEDASLTVEPGEVVGILGPNGAGKTTLLKAGLGLLPIERGEARLGASEVRSLSESERARLVGYLPQERRVGWNLSAARIASLGAPHLSPRLAMQAARERLAQVGLSGFEGRGVLDMSGGERARVLLARLLATSAPLLVADEPAAGLDPDAQLLTLELLRAEAERGAAVVVTLHDLTLAARACDRLVVMHKGRSASQGAPAQTLTPQVLAEVFGLEGELMETAAGLTLAARRIQPIGLPA
ncbi:MAG TPA: ABC transporter ATP-binding protein [Caulobacteraceae bacterium]